MEKYSIKATAELLGISERGVKYYKKIYNTNLYVVTVDRRVFLTQKFIDTVKKNRESNNKISSEPRTKDELLLVIEELENENKELKEAVLDYENSEVYEKANDGFRVEVFSQEEYDIFSERLIQWRLQRQEIEQTKVHFESVKDELVFVKGQLDYFKSSNDKILTQHQNLIDGLRERNRIEAVEKGAIPKEPREI